MERMGRSGENVPINLGTSELKPSSEIKKSSFLKKMATKAKVCYGKINSNSQVGQGKQSNQIYPSSTHKIFSAATDAVKEDENSLQGDQEIDEKGDTLTNEIKDHHENVIGTNKAVTMDSVSLALQTNRARQEDIKETLKSADDSEKGSLQRVLEELQSKEALLEKAVDEGRTWAAPDSARNLVGRCYDPKTKTTNHKKVSDNYLSVGVNLRHENFVDKEGNVLTKCNRGGAGSDYSNGRTNLKEIERMIHVVGSGKPLDESERKSLANIFIDKSKEEIDELRKDYPKLKTELEAAYEIRLMRCEDQELQNLYLHIENMSPDEKQNVLNGGDIKSFRVSLLDAEKAAKKVKGRLGKKRSGFKLNERNQLQDMEAVFEKFNGKNIVFDECKGPYVDQEGKVHMPKHLIQTEGDEIVPKEVKLKAVLFNVSCQGTTQNIGLQAKINSNALTELGKIIDKDHPQYNRYVEIIKRLEGPNAEQKINLEKFTSKIKEINKKIEKHKVSLKNCQEAKNSKQGNIDLKEIENTETKLLAEIENLEKERDEIQGEIDKIPPKPESSFSLATEIAALCKDVGGFVTLNCFSGKDRTGTVASSLILKKMKEENASKEQLDTTRNQLIGSNSILRKIIKQCTGHTVVKTTKRSVLQSRRDFASELARGGLVLAKGGIGLAHKPNRTFIALEDIREEEL